MYILIIFRFIQINTSYLHVKLYLHKGNECVPNLPIIKYTMVLFNVSWYIVNVP